MQNQIKYYQAALFSSNMLLLFVMLLYLNKVGENAGSMVLASLVALNSGISQGILFGWLPRK